LARPPMCIFSVGTDRYTWYCLLLILTNIDYRALYIIDANEFSCEWLGVGHA
jgi:hypothetical protein